MGLFSWLSNNRKKENIPTISNDNANIDRISTGVTYSRRQTISIFGKNNQNNYALLSMYNDLPDVFAPISFIIDACKIVPIHHMRNDKIVENSPVIETLKKPNQYYNQTEFLSAILTDYFLFGNAFINFIKPVGFRRVTKLYQLPGFATEPILHNLASMDFRENYVKYYRCIFENTSIEPTANEVFHMKYINPNPAGYYLGRSPLMSAFKTSESLIANYNARVSIYQRGGALAFITPTEMGTFQPADIKILQKAYDNKFGVNENQSPHMLADKPLNAQSIAPNYGGLQLNQNATQDFQKICSVLKIPSVLINDNTTSTYNNMATAIRMAYENVFIPNLRMLINGLSEKVFNLPKNEMLVPDFSEINVLQDDMEKKKNILTTLWNDNVLTREEYRVSMNYSDEIPTGQQTKTTLENQNNNNNE